VQARVVRRVQQKPNDGSTHWSCRKLAKELGVSKSTVQRILTQARLKPHRLERYLASDGYPIMISATCIKHPMNIGDFYGLACFNSFNPFRINSTNFGAKQTPRHQSDETTFNPNVRLLTGLRYLQIRARRSDPGRNSGPEVSCGDSLPAALLAPPP
jgi:hypothetical protein